MLDHVPLHMLLHYRMLFARRPPKQYHRWDTTKLRHAMDDVDVRADFVHDIEQQVVVASEGDLAANFFLDITSKLEPD